MAKIKSALFNEIRGKLKHLEFRVRKNGVIELSMKRIPAYTRTDAQDAIRKKYGQLVQEWKQLSETEKAQYEEQARRYAISGWNYYVMIKMPVQPLIFDNDGGGAWYHYVNVPITTAPSEYAQYKVVFNGDTIEIYSADGTLKTSGTGMTDFWNNIQSSGNDIRPFDDQKNQLYFWLENWDYTNKQATIWVKLPANAQELNIAYGNANATLSAYHDPKAVFDYYDDFSTDTSTNYTFSQTKYDPATSATMTVLNGIAKITIGEQGNAIFYTSLQVTNNFIAEIKARITNTGVLQGVGIALRGTTEDIDYYMYTGAGYEQRLGKFTTSTFTNLWTETWTIDTNWHTLKLKYSNGAFTLFRDENQLTTVNYALADASYNVGIHANYALDAIVEIDEFKVYKLSDTAQFGTPATVIIQ